MLIASIQCPGKNSGPLGVTVSEHPVVRHTQHGRLTDNAARLVLRVYPFSSWSTMFQGGGALPIFGLTAELRR